MGKVILVSILLAIGAVFTYFQYTAVAKHYKDMTFMDYMLTQDKLVITPDRPTHE